MNEFCSEEAWANEERWRGKREVGMCDGIWSTSCTTQWNNYPFHSSHNPVRFVCCCVFVFPFRHNPLFPYSEWRCRSPSTLSTSRRSTRLAAISAHSSLTETALLSCFDWRILFSLSYFFFNPTIDVNNTLILSFQSFVFAPNVVNASILRFRFIFSLF